jgi:hypothetical protein
MNRKISYTLNVLQTMHKIFHFYRISLSLSHCILVYDYLIAIALEKERERKRERERERKREREREKCDRNEYFSHSLKIFYALKFFN